MWRKVAWLFVWVTLAFWAGCATDNQNYRINEEQTPVFEEGYPTSPGGATDASEPSEEEEAGLVLEGYDRSGWQRQGVAAAHGSVPHHPRYFWTEDARNQWRFTPDRPSPLTREGDVHTRAYLATADARHEVGLRDFGDLVANIGKYAFDLATLPHKVVSEPPWRIHYSPRDPDYPATVYVY